jgi:hypothetical protein
MEFYFRVIRISRSRSHVSTDENYIHMTNRSKIQKQCNLVFWQQILYNAQSNILNLDNKFCLVVGFKLCWRFFDANNIFFLVTIELKRKFHPQGKILKVGNNIS